MEFIILWVVLIILTVFMIFHVNFLNFWASLAIFPPLDSLNHGKIANVNEKISKYFFLSF